MSSQGDACLSVVRTAIVGYLDALRSIDNEMATDNSSSLRRVLDELLHDNFGVRDHVKIPAMSEESGTAYGQLLLGCCSSSESLTIIFMRPFVICLHNAG